MPVSKSRGSRRIAMLSAQVPRQRLNLLQFVLYNHSVLTYFFRRSKTTYGSTLRARLFYFVFLTGLTLSVSMNADVMLSSSAHGDGPSGKPANERVGSSAWRATSS